MDWNNLGHVMQALMVVVGALALLMGYRAGDKL